MEKDTINIISVYAPQLGANSQLIDKFQTNMEESIQGILPTEKIVIGGDLNGHIGKKAGAHVRAHDVVLVWPGELNDEGQSIIDFSYNTTLGLLTLVLRREKNI